MEDRRAQASSLLVLVALSFYVYWFSEWLFLESGLSFLSALDFTTSAGVLLSSASLVLLPLLLSAVGCLLLWLVPFPLRKPLIWAILCVPVLLQTWTITLLVDNFTYTVFSIGVTNAGRTLLWVVRLGMIALFAFLFVRNKRWLSKLARSSRRWIWSALAAGLVLVSLLTTGMNVLLSDEPPTFALSKPSTSLPNILFLASDGLPADQLSAYGADRDTTPFLKEFKSKTLFFTNAFSDASSTFPSMSMLFTGKSVFTTKTFYTHMPLRGEDAVQHLPAILNQLGYSGLQVGDRTYANSIVQNMRHGFAETLFVDVSWLPSRLYHDVMLDLDIADRAVIRVRKLVRGATRMIARAIRSRARASARGEVAEIKSAARPADTPSELGDQARVDLLLLSLAEIREPFYAHVHLSETHVAASASQEEFDATIRASDGYFEQIISWLDRNGKLDHTLVVIGSDHSRRRHTYQRVPLMIYLPHAERTGVVDVNVQLLDVAPTILSYLGQPIPDWMEGESLLSSESISPERELFGFYSYPVRTEPPAGQSATGRSYLSPLGIASMVRCDEWFYYSIPERRLILRGTIETDRPSCVDPRPLSEAGAATTIERFLAEKNVDADDMPPSFAKLLPGAPSP